MGTPGIMFSNEIKCVDCVEAKALPPFCLPFPFSSPLLIPSFASMYFSHTHTHTLALYIYTLQQHAFSSQGPGLSVETGPAAVRG